MSCFRSSQNQARREPNMPFEPPVAGLGALHNDPAQPVGPAPAHGGTVDSGHMSNT